MRTIQAGVVAIAVSISTAAGQVIVTGPGSGLAPNVRTFANSSLDDSFFAYDPAFSGGVTVAAGDVNGDGTADIITGTSTGAAQVKAFDGITGTLIRSFIAYPSFTGGVYVAAGDINGDGYDDIITGVASGTAPHVKVFDGQTSAEIMSFFGFDVASTSGVTVAGGDIDGDGNADIIMGAASGGQLKVVRGGTGTTLENFTPFGPSYTGGVTVAAGDVNGDGIAEIVAGTASGSNIVTVYDGDTLGVLASFYAYTEGFTGGVRVAAGDVNGDHIPDIITGVASGGGPHVKAFAGPSFSNVAGFFAYDVAFTGGIFVGGSTPKPRATISGNTTLCSGTATISVTLTGRAPWSLTWNDGAVETAIQSPTHQRTVNTTGTFTITRVADPNHSHGKASGSAVVTEGTAISITVPPGSQTINPGATATFAVEAPGTISYQWYVGLHPDGVAIAGATASSYTTPQLYTSTLYYVVVSNGQCSARSTARAWVRLPPPVLDARGNGSGGATLTWTSLDTASRYEVWRYGGGTKWFRMITTTQVPSYNDSGLEPAVTYVYWVRGMVDTIEGLPSVREPATTITFADDALVPGVTIVKAAHIEELRTAINAFRAAGNLAPRTWTYPLVAGATTIRAVDLMELRSALNEARTAMDVPVLPFTDEVLNATVPVRAIHVEELRAGVR